MSTSIKFFSCFQGGEPPVGPGQRDFPPLLVQLVPPPPPPIAKAGGGAGDHRRQRDWQDDSAEGAGWQVEAEPGEVPGPARVEGGRQAL